MDGKNELVFHHIGCLTRNIEETKRVYASGLGLTESSEVFYISNQQVKVCFIRNNSDSYIELVEPVGESPSLNRLLQNNNTFYHLGYYSPDIDQTLARLQSEGYFLVNKFHSEAFSNNLCAFLYSPEKHLIEIIQK